ncbi:hypothetical protein B0T25DRAFT_572706 [Lasiosphaeria hispida]|uniref:BTB domain-containing protein n=1 Tax=Lasiosphaeria hispida TaxID=260671 RepID=A0AAJ0H962_9PEZI|nr:hypothetical protein B0T25DRAFT_572706 [Lasiosphaeria hispida]
MATDNRASIKTPLRTRLSGRSVKVIVGPEKQEWTIHEKLLHNASGFFMDPFTGPVKDASGVVHLHDDDPDAFALFVDWLYQSNLARPPVFRIEHAHGLSNYLALAVMAAKFRIAGLENDAIAAIFIYLKENNNSNHPAVKLEFADVRFVFDHTDQDSGLRRLVCHYILAHFFEGNFRAPGAEQAWRYRLRDDQEIAAELFNLQFAKFSSNCGTLFPFKMDELSVYQVITFDD